MEFIYSATFLLSIASLIMQSRASSTVYFYDQNRTTDYKYDSVTGAFDVFTGNISNGLCGADPRIPVSDESANYNNIAYWGGNYKPTNRASLYRGAGETANPTLEECLINWITAYNTDYEKNLTIQAKANADAKSAADAANAASVAEWNLRFGLGFGLGIPLGFAAIFLFAYRLAGCPGSSCCEKKTKRKEYVRDETASDHIPAVDAVIEMKEADTEKTNDSNKWQEKEEGDVKISTPRM